jgi:superfamily II DNA or RNA helicase
MAVQPTLPEGLWEHQRLAVEAAGRYLAAAEVGDMSALITMPTGTGKTGVIATIVTALPSVHGHRLVLTPWNALVTQLIDDLRGRFWQRLTDLSGGAAPPLLPVRRLPPSTHLDHLPNLSTPTIFVATIAAISVAANRADAGAYDLADIFRDFGCVIVDEGHYEPAAEWSDAIRSLKRRTILLTATPYRNDEKFFNVGPDWRYRFPHWRAEEERFLRSPEFKELHEAGDADTFADQLLAQLSDAFPDGSVRAIVRCATATSIRLVVAALEARGQSVVGVHERFESSHGTLRRTVPRPDKCAARFWVHQNKLIEGIDDPRFKVLAFYEALRNDRAIVQQIGRVLRNPARDPDDMKALVVGRDDRDVDATWYAYRRFDRQSGAESVATLPDLVGRVLQAQPEAFYYDGGYRVRIDLNADDAWRAFAFPLRTRVYRPIAEQTPTLDDLDSDTAQEWRELDRTVFTTQTPDEQTIIVPFVTAENSPLLRSGTFIEPEFGYTLIRLTPKFLFLYDSRGRTPAVVEENFRPLRPPDLQALFPKAGSSVTSVSLLNTDIGRQAARARHVRALAIDNLAPDLADYGYVCTIAEGQTEIEGKRFRRYLGLSRSRVSDYRSGERDFKSYSEWLNALEIALTSDGERVTTFTRYATYVDEPANKEPVHVLLDVDPTAFQQASTGDPLAIDETAAAVQQGAFTITANGQEHAAALTWDNERDRYLLSAPTLEGALFVTREGERQELVASINADQALRIIPAERTTIYTHGNFFKPVIPATQPGSFRLLDILQPTDELAAAGSEKGAAITDDDWEPASVFGLISALAPTSGRNAPTPFADVFPNPDFVLCTDLGTEVADFIIAQGSRVAFVHAKASSRVRKRSASALHDVAAQAIKNLPHLQPLADTPMATATWTQPWHAAGVTGSTRRLREGNFATGEEMWAHVRAVVAAPQSDREVWLVLGRSLSKSSLEAEAGRRRPAAEALQVFSLLQTTWGAVSQLGARLRIFCSS